MNHRTAIAGGDGAWQGTCSCKMRGLVHDHRWEAEDWVRSHLQQVDQVRAHLHSRQPGLKDQRDWYRKKASFAEGETRDLWLMLAAELDRRIGSQVHDETLF